MIGKLGRGKHGAKGVLLLLLCAAVLLLAGFRNGASEDKEINQLKRSLPLLSSLGLQAAKPDSALRLVLKWQGEYQSNDNSDVTGAAEKLSAELGLGTVKHTEEDGHHTYRSTAAVDAYTRVSMLWNELNEAESYVIVTVESPDLLKSSVLEVEGEQAGIVMAEFGISAEWNASIQGIAKVQGDPEQALIQTENAMSDQLSGIAAVESYKDDTTFSRSYTMNHVGRFVQSGNHSVAMQTAIHTNDTDNSNRITIGFPLITVEY